MRTKLPRSSSKPVATLNGFIAYVKSLGFAVKVDNYGKIVSCKLYGVEGFCGCVNINTTKPVGERATAKGIANLLFDYRKSVEGATAC